MVTRTLLVSALLHYAITATFVFVGYRLRQRHVPPSFQRAHNALVLWWIGLGLSTGISGTTDLLGSLDVTDLGLFATASQLNFIAIAVALAALLFYLGFLFNGRESRIAVAAFFAFVLVLLLYSNAARVPTGVEIQAWDTDLTFANPDAGPPRLVLVLFILLPPLAGAVTLLFLVRHTHDRTSRYRLVLVAGSLVIWFGGVLVTALLGLDTHRYWGLLVRLAGVGAALTALAAYFPPRRLAKRLGIQPVHTEHGGG